MENRVHQLRLKVSAPAGREPTARALADRFTRDVLDRCCNVLEARAPGRVILIRELSLRWSCTETELADPALADRCAAELTESIEAQANGTASAGSADAVVVFADEAAWLASYLKSQADRHADAWFHATWQGEGLSTHLKAAGGRDIARAALLRLESSGDLLAVLTRLPSQIITPLAKALHVQGIASYTSIAGPMPENDANPKRDTATATEASAREQTIFEISRSFPPTLSREAAAVALHIKIFAQTNDPAIAAGLSQLEPRAIPAVCTLPSDAPAPMIDLLADGQLSRLTQFGGLFFLLSLAVELGIGETLWKACLPEGLILAHAAAAILGPDCAGDPAPLFFGGVTSAEMLEFPSVTPEQHAAVSTELLANLVAAFPRRGLAEYPEVYIDIMETPAGRILAACPPGPFAIYAHPASDARSAANGIAEFLTRWPRSAPTPQARPVLAGLDPTARLQPAAAPLGPVERLIPSAASAPAAALLAQLCGSMGCLFTARATAVGEQSPPSAETFVSRFLEISGRINVEPERLTIVLPMDSVDLSLRKSALDRDPGWIEWLGRTVRIEFEPRKQEDAI
jgi:hypothetical protein